MAVRLSERDINQEYLRQAQTIGLQVQCMGAGDPNSTIAIIAEAPGEREIAMKMPQVGAGGRLLWEVLRKYNINRSDVWTTNVVKRQLLLDNDEKASIHYSELDNWHSLLRWELSQLPNLKHILVLGNIALEFFIGERGITKWRGSVLDWNGCKLLATYNPAMIIREPKWDIVFRFDIYKFNKVINGTFKPHVVSPIINPSAAEAIEWIDKMDNDRRPVALDIETLGGETACVGLANDATTGMCINFRDAHSQHYDLPEEARVRTRLARFLNNSATRLIVQNGPFDAGWLDYKDRVRTKRIWFDTLLAHHTLYPPLPHNLGFLTAQYTNHPYYKDDKKKWREGGDIDSFWIYNVRDCCITYKVHEEELKELRDQKLDDFFFNHVMRLQPWLLRASSIGIKADLSLKEKISADLRAQLGEKLKEIHQLIQSYTGDKDYTPNLLSPKQLRELFFTRMRLVGRGMSVDEDNRKRMMAHPRTSPEARTIIGKIDKYKEEQKFVSVYAEMQADPDGRIRTEYKQYGVVSAPGRLSSSQTAWETGGNVQNIPDQAGGMFVADQGYRFLYFDMSQAEARAVAYFANITKWKEQFERARIDGSYDCHRALASEMFDVPYEQVPEKDRDDNYQPTIRYIAKRCRHGLNYRMGPDRLATVTELPYSKAFQAHRIYHRITPELTGWWNRTIEEVRKTKQLWTPMGRRWILLERFDENALDSVVAFRPQSTIGDKVASAAYNCQEHELWPHDSYMFWNIHDAWITLVPDNDKDAIRAAGIIQYYMERPLIINGEECIIPCEFGWSYPDDNGIHRKSAIKKIKDQDILQKIRQQTRSLELGLCHVKES